MPKRKYVKRPFPRKGVDWDKIKKEKNDKKRTRKTSWKPNWIFAEDKPSYVLHSKHRKVMATQRYW